MRKILERSYECLIFIFFVLFVLAINYDAENSKLLFYIGMSIGAILLAIIPFLLNKCKNISARRFYLMGMVSLGAVVVLQSIQLVFIKYIFINTRAVWTVNSIFVWILRIVLALPIVFLIFTAFYGIKNFFKKKYSIEKFDLQSIKMIINLISYLLIILVIFFYSGYEVNIEGKFDYVTYEQTAKVNIFFGNFNTILNYTLIIAAIYVISYIAITLVTYYKFEKKEINK